MMPAPMRRRRALLLLSAVAAGGAIAACGTGKGDEPQPPANISRGAQLFAERCSGCHHFSVVGAEGGALKVGDRERADGPNFDVRREDVQSVLYAIRNGGFSGAIMPENIVGQDAQDVAAFVAEYAGKPRQGRKITPASQAQQP